MTRGRKPLKTTAPAAAPQLDEAALAVLDAAPAQLAAMQAGYAEDRDLLNQLLGQAQMADAFAKFSVTVTTSKLAFVKESKLYQQLKGKRTGDGHQFSGTWEEFCGLLGRSREQIDEDIRNLNAMGAEALESMSKMGIGYRELRQYRRLPEDQKQALIEVAKSGDKEGFVELAEQIIAKHHKEKEAAEAEKQQLLQDNVFTAGQLDKERGRADMAEKKLAGNRPVVVPLDERIAPFQVEIAQRQSLIERGIAAHHEATLALGAWWMQEATRVPGYGPEEHVPMPRSVALVALSLQDSLNRLAEMVGAAQHAFDDQLGGELSTARQYLLQVPDSAPALGSSIERRTLN